MTNNRVPPINIRIFDKKSGEWGMGAGHSLSEAKQKALEDAVIKGDKKKNSGSAPIPARNRTK